MIRPRAGRRAGHRSRVASAYRRAKGGVAMPALTSTDVASSGRAGPPTAWPAERPADPDSIAPQTYDPELVYDLRDREDEPPYEIDDLGARMPEPPLEEEGVAGLPGRAATRSR